MSEIFAWENNKRIISLSKYKDENYLFHDVPDSSRWDVQELHYDIYQAITEFLISKKIRTVAGPVLSGALMAHSIALFSNEKIRAIYLGKPDAQYTPAHHSDYPEILFPYVIVDDIICSGEAMRFSIDQCLNNNNRRPKYIIVFDSGPTTKHALPGWAKNILYLVKAKLK